jgi:hypothetical protein
MRTAALAPEADRRAGRAVTINAARTLMARPTRRSMALAVRSFILNRVRRNSRRRWT